MKTLTLWQLELIPWYAMAAYWLITSLSVKRTKAREKSLDRLITLVVVVFAYELLFADRPRIAPLQESLRAAGAVDWLDGNCADVCGDRGRYLGAVLPGSLLERSRDS